jgi:hypothetical protein
MEQQHRSQLGPVLSRMVLSMRQEQSKKTLRHKREQQHRSQGPVLSRKMKSRMVLNMRQEQSKKE